MESILPLLLFLLFTAVLAGGLLAVAGLIGPSRNSKVKEMPYESGMDPIHDTRRRFDVRFYLVAIAFLIFDVELLFLYPWAVASRNPAGLDAVVQATSASADISVPAPFDRTLVFLEVLVFLAMLALGFVYAWKKGVFRWR